MSICLSALIPLISEAEISENNNVIVKTNLQQKYYQQALYYYFQSNYVGALDVLSQSKLRNISLEPKAQLFEAGLLIKVGLYEQAKQRLLALSQQQIRNNNNSLKGIPYLENQVTNKVSNKLK